MSLHRCNMNLTCVPGGSASTVNSRSSLTRARESLPSSSSGCASRLHTSLAETSSCCVSYNHSDDDGDVTCVISLEIERTPDDMSWIERFSNGNKKMTQMSHYVILLSYRRSNRTDVRNGRGIFFIFCVLVNLHRLIASLCLCLRMCIVRA